jgi:hypothetical protein
MGDHGRRGRRDEGETMTRSTRPATLRFCSLLLLLVLVGACGGGPTSQATESEDASTVPASVAASEAPGSVEPASASPSAAPVTPEPTAQPTPQAVPPKPANVTFKHVGSKDLGSGSTRETYRLTWTAPADAATTFKVYGVTACLRNSKKYNGKPCLVKGMKIPKATLKLIAQVPGSERTVDIAWKEGEIPIGPYESILIRASNDVGESIFTIAWSATVCWGCTY